jgi:Transglutaminase-like superfamily
LKLFRQFATLTAAERSLLLRATALVAAVRVALWLAPFRLVRRWTAAPQPVSSALARIRIGRLAWAVQAAARRIPQATCLTQALALQRLLARAGRSAEVRIGVSLGDGAREFAAHAWVEYQGQILVGDNGELDRYAPIAALPVEEV